MSKPSAASQALQTPEILRMIAEIMDRGARSASLGVSRYWRTITASVAWRDVVINCHVYGTYMSTNNVFTLSLANTLSRWDDLTQYGTLVRNATIIVTKDSHCRNPDSE